MTGGTLLLDSLAFGFRGRKIYEPPRFMSTQVACDQLARYRRPCYTCRLLDWPVATIIVSLARLLERRQGEGEETVLQGSSPVVCLARY